MLAESRPGIAYAEGVVPVPFDRSWPIVADLEHTIPVVLTDLHTFPITTTDGTPTEALATSPLAMRARFGILMRPGYCLMRSRFLVGGFASVAEGDHSRLAFLGGVRLLGIRLTDRPIRSAGRHLGTRVIRHRTQHLTTP